MKAASDAGASAVVLLLGQTPPWLEEPLRAAHEVLALPPDEPERSRLLDGDGARVDVLAVSGRALVDNDLLTALPRLRLIANLGVGYDNVDVDAAVRRDVVVTNTPDVLTPAVAELAIGLAIATVRRMVTADRYVRAGRWATEGPFPLTGQLSGRRVGILGLGRIGRAVAVGLEPFGCRISYHNRRAVPGASYTYAPSVRNLAATTDVLVVTIPAGAATRRIVDRAALEALGPGGILVNVARGSVVDQDALVELLTDGRLGGAGLDVYIDEPYVPDALTRLDSVVLLPHVGSATTTTRHAMADLLVRNIATFVATGSALTPVQPCST